MLIKMELLISSPEVLEAKELPMLYLGKTLGLAILVVHFQLARNVIQNIHIFTMGYAIQNAHPLLLIIVTLSVIQKTPAQ